jgi:CelD/BcsL family acetyltransferase involved in cellulose biosynthesis
VLTRIGYDPDAWGTIVASHHEAEVFHSVEWLAFLHASQGAEPVIAVVRANGVPIGYFVGAIVRRFGIRILGSPLRGWTTTNMGFLLDPGADRRAAAEALVAFAFGELGCHHVELSDRYLTSENMTGATLLHEAGPGFRLDLQQTEDQILRGMRRTTRQEIGKAVRAGLRVEVGPDERFAMDYYRFLTAVFARQGLAPTYGIERVRDLLHSLGASGQLLALRVIAPDGRTIGTGISVGRGSIAYAWGMAFDREDQEHHAIELLWWESIRYWKSRGALTFEFGGGGEYKAKYGCTPIETVHFHRSRWAVMGAGRSAVRRWVHLAQVIGAWRR